MIERKGPCFWCDGNFGTLAPVKWGKEGPRVLCTECRRMFAPEGWYVPYTEEQAQQYCKESWEGIQ